MPVAPPPPSHGYLASIGKHSDGTQQKPDDDEPESSPTTIIVSIITSFIAVAIWIRVAGGFDTFLDAANVCAVPANPEVAKTIERLSIVRWLFKCSAPDGHDASWLAGMWSGLKNVSGAGDDVTALSVLTAPFLYSVGVFLSSTVGGAETAYRIYEYYAYPAAPDGAVAELTDDVINVIPGADLWRKALGLFMAMFAFWVGFWLTPMDVSARALVHLVQCTNCGAKCLTGSGGLAAYALFSAAFVSSLAAGLGSSDAIAPVVGALVLGAFPAYSVFSTPDSCTSSAKTTAAPRTVQTTQTAQTVQTTQTAQTAQTAQTTLPKTPAERRLTTGAKVPVGSATTVKPEQRAKAPATRAPVRTASRPAPKQRAKAPATRAPVRTASRPAPNQGPKAKATRASEQRAKGKARSKAAPKKTQ